MLSLDGLPSVQDVQLGTLFILMKGLLRVMTDHFTFKGDKILVHNSITCILISLQCRAGRHGHVHVLK